MLCRTADMSAVSHSKHVSCVTQLTCLPCDTADMSVVWHNRHAPPVCDTKPSFGDAVVEGKPTTQLSATAHTRLTLSKSVVLCRRRGGACPHAHAPHKHNFVSQTKALATIWLLTTGSRRLPDAGSSESDRPQLYGIRLGWVWTQK